jgi:3-methyladenine DNA glycosylase AlkD
MRLSWEVANIRRSLQIVNGFNVGDETHSLFQAEFPTDMSRELVVQLRSRLKQVADPERAPQMQKYMKSNMPYLGVPAPLARKVFKETFAKLHFENEESWRNAILYLWRNARFREEWYAAVALCECRLSKGFQTPDTLSLYEEMIVTGAWWDVVDALASNCVGELLRRYPMQIRKEMVRWSRSENMWKRRTSIICQLGFKEDTDLDLLFACIRPSLGSKEFFLRKAIGWALRQYAWTNPDEVRLYVRAHESEMSSLSMREALKNLVERNVR